MKFTAICIACGESKKWYRARCFACQFQPESSNDIAKSFMLTTAFQLSSEYGDEYLAEDWSDLKIIGEQIAAGRAHHFDAELLARTEKDIAEANSVTSGEVLKSLIVWLAPLILAVLAIALMHFLKK